MNFLKRCIELAEKGESSPNPKVGCVIVKDGKIISEGFHSEAGKDHAEIDALRKIDFKADGCEMYINLEPCCHSGKTGPCVNKIIESGVKKVVVSMIDPNPLVNGKGLERLKENGIEVEVVEDKKAEKLNEFYVKHITKKMPFVALKWAMTLDGKIADKNYNSKWISNEKSRRFAHKLRDEYDAILVGINTVLKDDPRLTCRINGKDPLRVIVDSKLKIGLNSNVLKDDNVIIATTSNCDQQKKDQLNKKILIVNEKGKVELKELMKKLSEMEITSVLIEGGSKINASALKEGIVDKVYCVIAPKVMGEGINAIDGLEIEKMEDVLKLKDIEFKNFDDDILITGYHP